MQEIQPYPHCNTDSHKAHLADLDNGSVSGEKKLGDDIVAEVDAIDGPPSDSFDDRLRAQVVHRKLNARQIQLSTCMISLSHTAITVEIRCHDDFRCTPVTAS